MNHRPNRQIFGDLDGCTDTYKTQDTHSPDSTTAKMAAHHEAWAKAEAEAATGIQHDDDSAMVPERLESNQVSCERLLIFILFVIMCLLSTVSASNVYYPILMQSQ